MAKLEDSLEKQIEKLRLKSVDLYQESNFLEAISVLEDAWILLPEPKVNFEESYTIANYSIEACLTVKDYNKARRWATLILICNLERTKCGAKYFSVGKVAFESGDLEMAKDFFYIANKESEGRCFSGEDKKYLQFFKS